MFERNSRIHIKKDRKTPWKVWQRAAIQRWLYNNQIFPETFDACQAIEKKKLLDKTTTIFGCRNEWIELLQVKPIKRNFDTLVTSLLNESTKNLPDSVQVQDALNNGKKYETVALKKFHDDMTYKLRRKVNWNCCPAISILGWC